MTTTTMTTIATYQTGPRAGQQLAAARAANRRECLIGELADRHAESDGDIQELRCRDEGHRGCRCADRVEDETRSWAWHVFGRLPVERLEAELWAPLRREPDPRIPVVASNPEWR